MKRTSWFTLSFVALFSLMFTSYAAGSFNAINHEIPSQDISGLIAKNKEEQNRQKFLDALSYCESTGNHHAIGDNGASIGPFQWQKPTLEDYLGKKVSYDTYYSIVTDMDQIRPITYDVIYNKGELWRWKICGNKLTKK